MNKTAHNSEPECETKQASENLLTEEEISLLDEMGLFGESRRRFLEQFARSGLSLTAISFFGASEIVAVSETDLPVQLSAEINAVRISLKINGAEKSLSLDSRVTLLDALRERMSGNLCRCGAYPNIVKAIKEVHVGEETAQTSEFYKEENADATV